jgi:hypothetical protein
MSINDLAKEVKKTLIIDKLPLFLDTNIYKYYSEYKTLDEIQFVQKSQEDPYLGIDMKNCEKVFKFIIKNKIIIKKNKMLEQEITNIIINTKNIKEKIYYEDLCKDIDFDNNITQYTKQEEDLAKQFAPKTPKKCMEHDFIIVICCNKDNTKIIVTKDRDDFRKCLKAYADNKDNFSIYDSNLKLIKLDQFALIIDKIENREI